MNSFETGYKQEITFVSVLIPFVLGIISLYECKAQWLTTYLILTTMAVFSYTVYKNIDDKKKKKLASEGMNAMMIYILFFFVGCLSVTLHKDYIYADYYAIKKSEYLKISVIDEPKIRPNIILFNATVTQSTATSPYLPTKKGQNYNFHPASGKLRIIVMRKDTTPVKLKYGDALVIPAKFTEIPAPENPFEFDFKSWLAMQNIYHQTILKPYEISELNTNTGSRLISFALWLREKQVGKYRKLIKNDDDFAVASTLILGDRADLSAEIMSTYSKTGTIHVLSVSGMHVGLVYLVLSRILWFLNKSQRKKVIKTILILLAIWFYTLLTGLSPSVLRSAIMISVFIIARLFNKNTNNYNIIAFTAFCLLLHNPFLIWDVGFQLSFMAVLGLIYLQPKMQQWLSFKHYLPAQIWSLIAMSLAAQLATYPFSVYYFHQFPVYFLLSNLFITLPAALIMYLGIIILIFRLDCLGPLFEWLINFTNAGLSQIATLPCSAITAIWLSKTELTLLCLSLIVFAIACAEFKKTLLIYSMIIFLSFQSLISYAKLQAFHQKKTIKFRLKKNYAVALISARHAVLFTDLKPGSKAFSYFIKPALDQHMITKITFRTANVTCVLKDNLIFDQLN